MLSQVGVFTDTNNGAFMAAVMAGGMVPPLAIALAMTLFKDRFDEKRTTIKNFKLYFRSIFHNRRSNSFLRLKSH